MGATRSSVASTPSARATAAISSRIGCDMHGADPASRPRSTTCAINGFPAIGKIALFGRRLDASRAGMRTIALKRGHAAAASAAQ